MSNLFNENAVPLHPSSCLSFPHCDPIPILDPLPAKAEGCFKKFVNVVIFAVNPALLSKKEIRAQMKKYTDLFGSVHAMAILRFEHFRPTTHPIAKHIYSGSIALMETHLRKIPNSLNCKMDCFGNTPLLYSVKQGKTEAVRKILSFRPSLETRDVFGIPALHYAVNISFEIVQILCEAGAIVDSVNSHGETALDRVEAQKESSDQNKILAYLKEMEIALKKKRMHEDLLQYLKEIKPQTLETATQLLQDRCNSLWEEQYTMEMASEFLKNYCQITADSAGALSWEKDEHKGT